MTSNSRTIAVGLALGLALVAAGCVTPRPAGEPGPFRVDILADDPRAHQWGASTAQVLVHPAVSDEVQALFGTDWATADAALGRLSLPASAFLARGLATRVLSVAGQDYVAAPGCASQSCATHRGLVLIRVDGAHLLARLDDGGFTHYYVRGRGIGATAETHAIIDAAWRALAATGAWASAPSPHPRPGLARVPTGIGQAHRADGRTPA